MAIKYPVDCITNRDKIEGIYSAQEKLRILHNIVGKWHREEITVQEKTIISNQFPSLASLSDKILPEQYWKQFTETIFDPRQRKISSEICRLKALLKHSVLFNTEVTEE